MADINDIPILPYYTVFGDDDFSGIFVLIPFSNIIIYKHNSKDLFIFKDLFSIVLADKYPNENFDNYNVIYDFNTNNKKLIVNKNYLSNNNLKTELNIITRYCYGSIADSDYDKNINLIGFDQNDVMNNFNDYIPINKLVITYIEKCYNILDIVNYYKTHNIDNNVDFNYQDGDNLYENMDDFKKRFIDHPYIVKYKEIKDDIKEFVEEYNYFINNNKKPIMVLIEENIEFVKNIGRLGIYAISDNSHEQYNSNNNFKLTSEFMQSLFMNLTDSQQSILRNPLFKYNKNSITQIISTTECIHGIGFNLAYIFTNVLEKVSIFNADLYKKLIDNKLFIKISNTLYMSCHVTDPLTGNLSLINENVKDNDLNLVIIYFNLELKINVGMGYNYGRSDITNVLYILDGLEGKFKDNYESKYNMTDKMMYPVYNEIQKLGEKYVFDYFKKGLIDMVKEKNKLFEEISIPIIEDLSEKSYRYYKIMKKEIDILVSQNEPIDFKNLEIIKLLLPVATDIKSIDYFIKWGSPKSSILKQNILNDINNYLYLEGSDNYQRLKILINSKYDVNIDYILSIISEIKFIINKNEQIVTEILKKYKMNIVNIINLLRRVHISKDWISARYENDKEYFKEIIKLNKLMITIRKEDNVKSILDYYLKDYLDNSEEKVKEKKKALEQSMIDIPKDGNCMFNCFCKLRNNEDPTINLSIQQCRRQITDMIRYLYKNFNDFKNTLDLIISSNYNKNFNINEYILYMNEDGSYGDSSVLIAASQLYNINIIILSGDEYKTETRITPIYTNTILKGDVYKTENRGTWTLIYQNTNVDDNINLNKDNNYNYRNIFETGNLEFRMKFIDYILTKFLIIDNPELNKNFESDCLNNPFVKCNEGQVCDITSDVSKCKNISEYKEDILYKYVDKKGNVYIGYESDLKKFDTYQSGIIATPYIPS